METLILNVFTGIYLVLGGLLFVMLVLIVILLCAYKMYVNKKDPVSTKDTLRAKKHKDLLIKKLSNEKD